MPRILIRTLILTGRILLENLHLLDLVYYVLPVLSIANSTLSQLFLARVLTDLNAHRQAQVATHHDHLW